MPIPPVSVINESTADFEACLPRLRRIRPRRPDPYDNEIHGRDPGDGIVRSADDWQDSRVIAFENRHYDCPPASDRWFESEAANLLAQLPRSRLWVPVWVAQSTGHPARTILLSWLLQLFSEGRKADDNGNRLCRARAIDPSGSRWWQTTRNLIARETLLDIAAADRARHSLVKGGFIESVSRPGGLLLRPLVRGLAKAYWELTDDTEVLDELKHLSAEAEWFGSHTRVRTAIATDGTALDDAVMVICDRRPGPALVLSNVLYWHGRNVDGRSRARITRNGHLWIARSWRQLSANPGGDPGAMARYVRWLSDKAFLIAESRRWRWQSSRDRGRPTLHLRPNCEGIINALNRRWEEIKHLVDRKYISAISTGTPSDAETETRSL